MTAKLTDIDLDYLVSEYRSGRSAKDVGRELGIGVNTVLRRLRERGISPRPSAFEPRVVLPVKELLELYHSGIGVTGVAKHFGCTANPVKRILRASGEPLRNRHEQQLARMARMTPEERKALAQSANEAKRGRPNSFEQLCRAAKTRQARKVGRSEYDIRLRNLLRRRGLAPVEQMAIGPYNCDLTVDPVAVEVFGGHWHWHGDHAKRAEERFRYIMDQGWCILAITVNSSSPLTPAVADYVAAYIERIRRKPPAVREYRVVWGAGEFTTGGRADDDEFSLEPPFTGRRNSRTGQYETASR